MAITQARAALGRIFYQRCFYLFLVLLALIIGVPFIEPTPTGRFFVNVTGTAVVIAAVATVGRTRLSFIIAFLLAIPAAIFHWLRHVDDDAHYLFLSASFGAGLYAMTLAYLLRYVFERDVITADRLFGAASAYLIIGVLWAYLFAIVGHVYPESFAIGGQPPRWRPTTISTSASRRSRAPASATSRHYRGRHVRCASPSSSSARSSSRS